MLKWLKNFDKNTVEVWFTLQKISRYIGTKQHNQTKVWD